LAHSPAARLLGGYSVALSGLFARLCHAFLVYAVNAHIEVAIFYSVSECYSDKCREGR